MSSLALSEIKRNRTTLHWVFLRPAVQLTLNALDGILAWFSRKIWHSRIVSQSSVKMSEIWSTRALVTLISRESSTYAITISFDFNVAPKYLSSSSGVCKRSVSAINSYARFEVTGESETKLGRGRPKERRAGEKHCWQIILDARLMLIVLKARDPQAS